MALPVYGQEAWQNVTVSQTAHALLDLGSVRSLNVAATIGQGRFFVTDLGDAPSGTFRRIRNAGKNAIPFVMDGVKIIGFAPASPAGAPGGSGDSHVLPVSPNEVVEFVSLGGGAWQLVNYVPIGIENFGLQEGYARGGVAPTASPPENWFQLGPIAGTGPEPDYAFAVNWSLHGGKLHTHGAYFMLPGDTPNIELRQADIDPVDESPRPWTHAPYLGAHISGRALVDLGGGKFGFMTNEQPGSIGYRHAPSYLYQGFTANIDFPITQPPTGAGDGGALVFKITPNDTVTPFQRGWFSNSGNFVEIGKGAFEACGLHYPYDYAGQIWSADSPCKDADYFDTPGWANISVIATDINSPGAAQNAAIAIREFGRHGEGMDVGYNPAGHGVINRYGVHLGARTVAETFDPTNNIFTYPAKPAFEADLTSAQTRRAGADNTGAIVFDVLQFDQGRNYDPRTGRFIAPVDGIYQFETTVSISGLKPTSAHVVLSIVTSTHTYRYSPGQVSLDSNNQAGLHFSVLTHMKTGDIASVAIDVEHAGEPIGVRGGDLHNPLTTFSGFLVG